MVIEATTILVILYCKELEIFLGVICSCVLKAPFSMGTDKTREILQLLIIYMYIKLTSQKLVVGQEKERQREKGDTMCK